ncbi:hypothetical protein GCM10023086_16510 [Streptomyces venetus]|uniref:Uncharacterized protein n=1 Tax=Streptomyces venetus TaxID=1701086 RepID=A0ABP8FD35_9ACTN
MTALDRALAKAVMDLVISIELTDDEDIDPDVATQITEPVGGFLREALDNASEEDRQAVIGLFREIAAEEGIPERRELALQFPEAMCLVPED